MEQNNEQTKSREWFKDLDKELEQDLTNDYLRSLWERTDEEEPREKKVFGLAVDLATIGNILLILFMLIGCSKPKDYSYLNTDRRPQVILYSERFTNPPTTAVFMGKLFWVPDTILVHYLPRTVGWQSYVGHKNDTDLCNTSSPAYPKYPVDISYYKVKFY